jgi:hypothetical protein
MGSPSIGARPEGIYEFEVIESDRDREGRRLIQAKGKVIDPPLNVPPFAQLTWRERLCRETKA